MVYTYGCIDIIIKRSALDRNPIAKDGVIVDGPFGTTTKCDWIRECGGGWAYREVFGSN